MYQGNVILLDNIEILFYISLLWLAHLLLSIGKGFPRSCQKGQERTLARTWLH